MVRKLRLSRSPSFLSGFLYDDGGNRMSPSHANKRGARYRYYVSQALLQNRKTEAGSTSRVPAPDVEDMVVAAIRQHIAGAVSTKEAASVTPNLDLATEASARDLVALNIERIVLRARCIEI